MFGRSLTTTALVFGLATSAFAQASGGAAVTGASEPSGAANDPTNLPGVAGPEDLGTTSGTAGTGAGAAASNCGVETSMHGTGTAGSAGVADVGVTGAAGSSGASGAAATVDAC